MFVVGKEPKLLSVSLAIVKDDGALPALFLIVIEFAQMSDDMLPRPRIRANAFDEGIVGEVDPILWTKKGPSLATLLPAFLTGNAC